MIDAIKILYPDADPMADFRLRDDGTGVYIDYWNAKLGPMPTDDEISAAAFEASKVSKVAEIDAARDAAIDAGMHYTFGTTEDVVQTRERDRGNLQAIAIKARDLQGQGVTDPVIPFRAASDMTHMLTPDEAVAMTDAAFDFISGLYQQAWAKKDAAKAATTEAELEAVVW